MSVKFLTLVLLAGWSLLGCSEETTKRPDGSTGGKDLAQVKEVQVKETRAPDRQVIPGDAPAPKKVADYVPKGDELPGWSEDTSLGAPGVEAGYDKATIEGLIDGHEADYATDGYNGFAQEFYKKGNTKIRLYLWDMKTAAGATNVYNNNKTKGETQSGLTFETIAGVIEAGIIANRSPTWTAYAHKGHYFVDVQGKYTATEEIAPLKDEVIAFVKLVTGKLP